MSDNRCTDAGMGESLRAYEPGLLDDTERQQFEAHLLIEGNLLCARVLNLAFQRFDTDDICRRLSIKAPYRYVILARSRETLRKCLEKE